MNKLPADAIVSRLSLVFKLFINADNCFLKTLGNHEFDHGVEGVVPFIEKLTSPIVVVNIDDSEEPDIQGTYQKSTIVERNGRKIGIIGVILQTTDVILVFVEFMNSF